MNFSLCGRILARAASRMRSAGAFLSINRRTPSAPARASLQPTFWAGDVGFEVGRDAAVGADQAVVFHGIMEAHKHE